MNDIFKEELKEYIKQNFNYEPEFGKNLKKLLDMSKRKNDLIHFIFLKVMKLVTYLYITL